MSRRELVVLVGITLALNSAHWAFSFSQPPSTSQLAQAAKVVTGSSTCKAGASELASPGTVTVQECKRGAEYEVSVSTRKDVTLYEIRTTKCPPPAPAPPRGVTASTWQKQWELKQPDGVVRMKTPDSGTVVALCDKTVNDAAASLAKQAGTGVSSKQLGSFFGGQPAQSSFSTAGTEEDLWSKGAPSAGSIGESFDGLAPKTRDGTDPTFKSVDEEIAEIARRNIAADPRIEGAAAQFAGCSSAGRCAEPQYIGVESSRTLGQSLNDTVRAAVRENTSNAIAERYTADGTGFEIKRVQGGAVTSVVGLLGDKYYDNDTARLWLERPAGERDLIIYTLTGDKVRTSSDDASWTWALPAVTNASPEKYDVFEREFYDGAKPVSFELGRREVPGAEEPTYTDVVLVQEDGGGTRLLSRDVYEALRVEGDIAHGVYDIKNRLVRDTKGRVTFDAPYSFADKSGVGTSYAPPDSMTQLPSKDRATALSLVEEELNKYPARYWDIANPATIYTYGVKPGFKENAGGYAWIEREHLWLSGKYAAVNPDFFRGSVSHELAHYNDKNTFPSDPAFASAVYGSAYGKAYAGSSGSDALLAGKFSGEERPAGFARDYGYQGGIQEDKATIVEAMFKNYSSVEGAIKIDPVLAKKVQILQRSFSQATGGAMGGRYWRNLQPINPTYQLPPTISKPSFVETFSQKLRPK